MAGKSHTNPSAFALEIIGSLIYLYLVYVVSVGGYGIGNPVLSGAGTVWLPILYSMAVIGAVMLFLASFTNLAEGEHLRKVAFAPAVLTGFALVAFTAGSNWIWAAIVAFVISVIGVGLSAGKGR